MIRRTPCWEEYLNIDEEPYYKNYYENPQFSYYNTTEQNQFIKTSREFETDCNDMINIHPFVGPETKVKGDQPEMLPEPQALQSSSSSFITEPFMGSSSAVRTRYV